MTKGDIGIQFLAPCQSMLRTLSNKTHTDTQNAFEAVTSHKVLRVQGPTLAPPAPDSESDDAVRRKDPQPLELLSPASHGEIKQDREARGLGGAARSASLFRNDALTPLSVNARGFRKHCTPSRQCSHSCLQHAGKALKRGATATFSPEGLSFCYSLTSKGNALLEGANNLNSISLWRLGLEIAAVFKTLS